MGNTSIEVLINTIKIAVIFVGIVSTVPLLVWVERRGSAFMQNRLGPNRVGPLGLIQLLADAVKFVFKEEFIPNTSEKVLYFMAPGLALLPAALTFAVVPLSTPITLMGTTINLQMVNMEVGILFLFAAASLGVYGILAAGWSSSNKYSLMGALRATSQMVSYECAMGMSVIGILMLYQTFSLNNMIDLQMGPMSFMWQGSQVVIPFLPNWGIFYQPLAFVLFITASFAETNRLPFDLPEGEAELVGGFHTEFSGFKFNMFFMAEYAHMITASALITILFFGGYLIPGKTPAQVLELVASPSAALAAKTGLEAKEIATLLSSLIHLTVFLLKTGFGLFLFIWIRWSQPRFRYDQLMDLGWKTLLPYGMANLVITALVMFFSRVKL